MEMSKSREQLNGLLNRIDIEGKRVLDIGCQDKPASLHVKGQPDVYFTNDIDPKWNPDFVFDLNEANISVVSGGKIERFDVVFCLEVLEHCWNPVNCVQNLSNFLAKGGDLYISTPFINPHHDEWDFLRYTNEWYEKVLPMFDIEIVDIFERKATTGLASLQEFYVAEGMKYSKIRQKKGPYSYPVGYFIHARKV